MARKFSSVLWAGFGLVSAGWLGVGCSDETGDDDATSTASSGEGGASSASNVGSGGDDTTQFDCYGTNDGCDASTQYCIVSTVGSTDLAGDCFPLPSGCSGCDCASEDAPDAWFEQEDGSNNCDGATLLCDEDGGRTTVTCAK